MTLERLAPGVYAEGGTLHLDLPELCEAAGVPPTQENQDALQRAAERAFADVPVEEIDDGGRGAWRPEGGDMTTTDRQARPGPQLGNPGHAGHHRLLCSCGAVLAQCRCPGPKPDRISTELCPHRAEPLG